MILAEMIELLKNDLRNEWTHLTFYLHSAGIVTGLHCHEYKELFLEEAKKEMDHVAEFSDLIVGLGGVPTNQPYMEKIPNYSEDSRLTDPVFILSQALKLEEEVVTNYCARMKQAEEMCTVDGDWIHIFLEKQVEESRKDVDHLKQILRGNNLNRG